MTSDDPTQLLSTLQEQAGKLNRASDRINDLLSSFEQRIRDAKVGLEFWYQRPLETSVAEGDSGPHATQSCIVRYLGLARIGENWCLALKPIRQVSGYYQGDEECPWQEEFSAGETIALLKASRSLRIAAVRAMPLFLAELTEFVTKAVADIEAVEKTAGATPTAPDPPSRRGKKNEKPGQTRNVVIGWSGRKPPADAEVWERIIAGCYGDSHGRVRLSQPLSDDTWRVQEATPRLSRLYQEGITYPNALRTAVTDALRAAGLPVDP